MSHPNRAVEAQERVRHASSLYRSHRTKFRSHLPAILVLTIAAFFANFSSARAQEIGGHAAVQNPPDQKLSILAGVPACVTAAVESSDSASGASIMVVKLAAGCAVPWHWHSQDEHVMIITGTGRAQVKDDPPIYVHPGGYLRVPAHRINRFSCSDVCTSFVYSSAMFDIHYVDAAGKEIPLSEAEKIAGMEKQGSAAVGQTADAEFRELIERYYTEWSTLDPDKAAPLYAKDSDLVFFDLAPMKYTGWMEYREGVKKNFFEKMSSGKVTPGDDLKVVRRGDIAWTTVTNHFDIMLKDGRRIETDGRHTAIWERRDGTWLIVHEHVSAPLPPL